MRLASSVGPILTGCWILFLGYWLVSAIRVKPTAVRQSSAEQLLHRGPLLVAYLLIAGWIRLPGLDTRVLAANTETGAIAVALGVAGVALAVWARTVLGGNWSGSVTIKQGHELIQTGPYRWVRNPIYTGMLMLFSGTAIALGNVQGFLGLALSTGALLVKIGQEERYMARQFPETFAAYRKNVPALIPFLY